MLHLRNVRLIGDRLTGDMTVRQTLAVGVGTVLIAGGLLGASVTFVPSGFGVDAQERGQPAQEQSESHEQMDQMMDQMMDGDMMDGTPEPEESR